jgi:hypothetical protein
MSSRTPVVLSQAHAAGASARQLEEELIAGLMFERGVDVSVVPDLTQLHDGTTGLLCLRGIQGDLIVLTWLEPESAARMLRERGVSGRDWLVRNHRVRTRAADAATWRAARSDRRLHILRLDAALSAEWYLREIRRLRNVTEPDASQATELPVLAGSPQPPRPASAMSDAASPPAGQALPDGADELDHLLDQLDALDL